MNQKTDFSLFFALLLLVFGIPNAVYAQSEYTIGYTNSADVAKPLTYDGSPSHVSAAIHLPASMLLKYRGAKITKIRVGLQSGTVGAQVWIRRVLSESSSVVQSVPAVVDGWNEVTLAEPYELTGEELYVGVSTTHSESVKSGILMTGKKSSYDASLFALDGKWFDGSKQGHGANFIEAVVSASLPNNDFAVLEVATDSLYYRSSGSAIVRGKIANFGLTNASGATLHWMLDGKELNKVEHMVNLATDETANIEYQLPLTGLSEGYHEVAVVAVPQGFVDEKTSNDTARTGFVIYDMSPYQRKILLEHFTSLPCVNCPKTDRLLESVTPNHNVSWAAHHVGFANDEFTIEGSRPFVSFGINGNPYVMLDRTADKGEAAYVINDYSEDKVETMFSSLSAVPAFVELSVSATEMGGAARVTVSGNTTSYFRKLFPKVFYNVFLVEDSVTAKKNQIGDPTKKVHSHIVRAVLTPSSGQPVNWQDSTSFSGITAVKIDPSWSREHLRFVAFITLPAPNGSGWPTGQVLNTAEVSFFSATGITSNTISDEAPIYDGTRFTGAKSIRVYTLSGQELPNGVLSSGFYIVRSGAKSWKISIK